MVPEIIVNYIVIPGLHIVGRLQSVRRASSRLVFLDLTGEFEHVQAMCNFRKLEPTGLGLDAFKDFSKLLRRGDLICM